MMNIGAMITNLRREINMTQKELSVYLNLSTSTISNYENNVHYPDLVTVDKLADLFHVTSDYILGRTNYRCPPELLEQYCTTNSEVEDLSNRLMTLTPDKRHTVEEFMDYLASNKPEA